MVACQQFRTRDCKLLTCYLLCATQPAIEASNEVKFGPFSCNYPQLLGMGNKSLDMARHRGTK